MSIQSSPVALKAQPQVETGLKINVTGADEVQSEYGSNQQQVPGVTNYWYEGLGKESNIQNLDNVAFFFSDYAAEQFLDDGENGNLRIEFKGEDSGGYRLLNDIITRAGDDSVLSQAELQAWADEIGFTGDIMEVMTALSEIDNYLYGTGALELEDIPVAPYRPVLPDEPEAESDEADGTPPSDTEPEPEGDIPPDWYINGEERPTESQGDIPPDWFINGEERPSESENTITDFFDSIKEGIENFRNIGGLLGTFDEFFN